MLILKKSIKNVVKIIEKLVYQSSRTVLPVM